MLTADSSFVFSFSFFFCVGGFMFVYSTFLLIKSDLRHVFEHCLFFHMFFETNVACCMHKVELWYLPNAFLN